MRIFSICLLSFLWSLSLSAQNNFEVELLCDELLIELNILREKKNLKAFSRTEVLDAVAFDQSEYILKTGNLSHIQENEKRKTLSDRILYYEGLYSQTGENISQIGLNSKVELELGQTKKVADTPQKMILGAINSWLNEEEGKLNIYDPNFLHCGISMLENNNRELIIVLVMASEEFEAPSGMKLSYNNYGIEKYSKEDCEAFLTEFGSLSQLFSDGIVIENGDLRFKYNSLTFWDEIIANGKDGLAVEIIKRDQYSCSSTNKLFPGEITNGLLLKPFYKSKLTSLNTAIESNEVDINLGELPPFYNDTEYEINGMILKNGKKCISIPFNRLNTENVKWLNIPFKNSKSKLDSVLVGGDTIQVQFPFKKFDFELSNLKTLLSGLHSKIEVIDIKLSVSPASEISEEETIAKVTDALGIYFLPNAKTNFSLSVDWEGYEKFKEGTFYQLETKDYTKEQEIEYLKETKQVDKDLLVALNDLIEVDLAIEGKYQLGAKLSYEDKIRLLSVLVQKDKIDFALFFQNELIDETIKNKKKLQLMVTGDQEQLKRTLPLINNQIITQHTLGKRMFDGNAIHTAFLELYLIDAKDAILAYNYHLALLKYWSESVSNISEIDKWRKGFEKIKNSPLIANREYASVFLNYLLIAADYYYEVGNFEKRKKVFNEVLRYTNAANLSSENLLSIAQYLCYQDQYPKAIKLLLSEVKKENVSKEVIFYFLQIAIYDKNQVEETAYVSLLKKAQKLYPSSFCELFSKQKMGIQQLINPEIKELYCIQCHE